MFSWLSRSSGRAPAARPSQCPAVEILEDRSVPSVSSPFTITADVLNETTPVTAGSANGMSVVVYDVESGSGDRDLMAQT